MPTVTGKVKWYNDAKGYGFVTPDDGAKDILVNHTMIQVSVISRLVHMRAITALVGIQGVGFKSLVEGQAVDVEVEEGEGGKKALRVNPK